MLSRADFYIDLGTANTLIYSSANGFVLNEASVLSVHAETDKPRVLAAGSAAKEMLGKAPRKISVVRPLQKGVIADFDQTALLLKSFMEKSQLVSAFQKRRVLISLPCRVSSYERSAVEEIGHQLGARKVSLLHEPIAAAIGAGVDVLASRGCMVVDIGGGTTEIAVLSLGGIVSAEAVRTGGNNIDAAIALVLRNQFNFSIGMQTAERLKLAVGTARLPVSDENLNTCAGGLNLERGLPGRIGVDSAMIFPAIDGVLQEILQAMRNALASVPPRIAEDILQHGILLAGGGALLRGVVERLEKELGLPVKVAPDPLMSVANGGAKALQEPRLFDALQYPGETNDDF